MRGLPRRGRQLGDPGMPSLAGQPKQFITTQLVMFREGNRKDAADERRWRRRSPTPTSTSSAAYFSAQKRGAAGQEQARRCRRRAAASPRSSTACQCHGAELQGQQHIPRLAGQQSEYLRTQLLGFKAQTRFDMDGNMTSAAQALAAADIEVLAVSQHVALNGEASAVRAVSRARRRASRATAGRLRGGSRSIVFW